MVTSHPDPTSQHGKLAGNMHDLEISDPPRQILTQEKGYVYVEGGNCM
jgi:hypothetical protein